MGIKESQEAVDKWTANFEPQYWKPHEILARLTEEVGELAREINHLYGPKKKKDTEEISSLEDELGDVLYTIICLANSRGISLDNAIKRVLDKYKIRDKDRYTKKEDN